MLTAVDRQWEGVNVCPLGDRLAGHPWLGSSSEKLPRSRSFNYSCRFQRAERLRAEPPFSVSSPPLKSSAPFPSPLSLMRSLPLQKGWKQNFSIRGSRWKCACFRLQHCSCSLPPLRSSCQFGAFPPPSVSFPAQPGGKREAVSNF